MRAYMPNPEGEAICCMCTYAEFLCFALRMWNEAPVGVFLFFILLDLFYFLWFLFQPFQHRMVIARKRSRAYCFVLLEDETAVCYWKRCTKQNWLNCYKETENAKYFHFYIVLKILIKILPHVRLKVYTWITLGCLLLFFLA